MEELKEKNSKMTDAEKQKYKRTAGLEAKTKDQHSTDKSFAINDIRKAYGLAPIPEGNVVITKV